MSIRERLARANPVPRPQALLDAPEALDAFVLAVKLRSGLVPQDEAALPTEERPPMQTQDRTVRETTRPPRPRRRGWLIAAAAFVVAAVIGGAAAFLTTSGSTGDVASPPAATPLQTVETFYERFDAGDVEGMMALMAAQATFTDPFAAEEPIPYFAETDAPLLTTAVDWTGDGLVTLADNDAEDAIELAIAGGSLNPRCTAAAGAVTCTENRTDGFISAAGDAEALVLTAVYTVEGGLITDYGFEPADEGGFAPSRPNAESAGRPGRVVYQSWVEDNHASEAERLFNPFGAGQLVLNPDTVDDHRRLAALWLDSIG